jgi:methionyl-tRNA formyltransferase
MLREIVLLTGPREAPHLTAYLTRHNADLRVTHVETREDLICALHPARPGLRLIGFCTSTVVPADLLGALEAGAYNFHPGPPNYPGRHPASFAIYEGATRFAATAHEMRARVDSGPIVGVEWFDMPPLPRLSQLEGLTYDTAVRLFSRLGPLLATSASPLPAIAETWSGRKSTQHDFDAMCALPRDIDAAELSRRTRAFADGLPGSLYVTLHGRRFKLVD